MGNNITTFCSCSENQKATEHTVADYQQPRGNFFMQNDKHSENSSDELMVRKSKGMMGAVGSLGVSDADTSEEGMTMGTIKLPNDLIYIGTLVHGKKSGKGVIKNRAGQMIYEGCFKDDLYEGEGTEILENGLIFNGCFSKGKKDGRGLIFSTTDKFRYDGEWKNDQKSGQGTETYPDGSSYVGSFRNNFKNGKGIYYMNDGSIYEGDFVDDRFEGEGKVTWSQDKVYIGEWKNNSLNGFGIFVKKRKVYIGNFVNDIKQGVGIYLLNNGNILIGNFENGEIEGLALVIPAEGPDHLCFMEKSKPSVIITDENEKKNIKLSIEYKALINFYEQNKSRLDNFLTNNNFNYSM